MINSKYVFFNFHSKWWFGRMTNVIVNCTHITFLTYEQAFCICKCSDSTRHTWKMFWEFPLDSFYWVGGGQGANSKQTSDSYWVVWFCSKISILHLPKADTPVLKEVMEGVAWGYLQHRLIPSNRRTPEEDSCCEPLMTVFSGTDQIFNTNHLISTTGTIVQWRLRKIFSQNYIWNNLVICTFSAKNVRGLYRFLSVEILNAETGKDCQFLCQHIGKEHVAFIPDFRLICRMLQYVSKWNLLNSLYSIENL